GSRVEAQLHPPGGRRRVDAERALVRGAHPERREPVAPDDDPGAGQRGCRQPLPVGLHLHDAPGALEAVEVAAHARRFPDPPTLRARMRPPTTAAVGPTTTRRSWYQS